MIHTELTIDWAQQNQPWTVPYSSGVQYSSRHDVPHILASHDVLHAIKTLGKLASVFEALDHSDQREPDDGQLDTIKDMSADLVTAALRLGNLYQFSVAEQLIARVKEKNGVTYPDVVRT